MKDNKETKSLTFWTGSEVVLDLCIRIAIPNEDPFWDTYHLEVQKSPTRIPLRVLTTLLPKSPDPPHYRTLTDPFKDPFEDPFKDPFQKP